MIAKFILAMAAFIALSVGATTLTPAEQDHIRRLENHQVLALKPGSAEEAFYYSITHAHLAKGEWSPLHGKSEPPALHPLHAEDIAYIWVIYGYDPTPCTISYPSGRDRYLDWLCHQGDLVKHIDFSQRSDYLMDQKGGVLMKKRYTSGGENEIKRKANPRLQQRIKDLALCLQKPKDKAACIKSAYPIPLPPAALTGSASKFNGSEAGIKRHIANAYGRSEYSLKCGKAAMDLELLIEQKGFKTAEVQESAKDLFFSGCGWE